MLKRIKALLTARSTVLVVLLLVVAALAAAVLVPQDDALARRLASAAAGGMPSAPPERSWLVRTLGLGHVFTTWWFAALAVAFVLLLALSTWDQLKVCRARTRQPPPPRLDGVRCALPRAEVERVLAGEGYRRLSASPGRTRHVKYWIGYWGSFLLHLGMTVTVMGALVYVLTQHRVGLRLLSGAELSLEEPGTIEEQRGLLAGPLPLPARATLFRLEPHFRDDDQLGDLASHLVFVDPQGAREEVRVGVNDFQSYRGLLVYQQLKLGNAFALEFRGGPGGDFDRILWIPLPSRRDRASYDTVPVEGPLQVRAKYYANADRSRIMPENPQLWLRTYRGEQPEAEVSLLSGQSAQLGPWQVRLVAVAWWTEILFEGSRGTAAIFSGFALLLLGGALAFFSAPREAVVADGPEGCSLSWRTTRFPEFYREEGDRILARCQGANPS